MSPAGCGGPPTREQGPIKQIQVGGGSTEDVEQFVVAEIKPDVCWRDAGGSYTWYPSREGPYGPGGTTTNPEFTTMGWLNTGTWEIDREKYPQGFRPFSDWCRGRGMQFLLWFEPERVGLPMSWLATMHREWRRPAPRLAQPRRARPSGHHDRTRTSRIGSAAVRRDSAGGTGLGDAGRSSGSPWGLRSLTSADHSGTHAARGRSQ